jgi:2-oxoglutarate dehydrogenase complex dehydrogenase (E1) component-like enzyme
MVLDDPGVEDRSGIGRLLLCSGKVYYDLLAEREKRKQSQTAILRIEQLYPFPEWNLSKIISGYEQAREIFWVQEEPRNMGAWNFISRHIEANISIGRSLRYIGRPESASPASGSHKTHQKEQAKILHEAFE